MKKIVISLFIIGFSIIVILSCKQDLNQDNETSVSTNQDPSINLVGKRIVLTGDAGDGGGNQHAVGSAIRSKCESAGCDMVLLLGDNFYPSGVTSNDDPQFQTAFERPYEGINAPFYVTLGNHDYKDTDFSRGVYQVNYSNVSSRWKLPAEYYHFEEDDMLFLSLGTNRVVYGDAAEYTAQANYFKPILDSSTKHWKIAFGHHPYLSNGGHGNAGNPEDDADTSNFKTFFENEICNKVDLYIAGHDHSLQVLKGIDSCPHLFIVSGSGGHESSPFKWNNPSYFQTSAFGFIYLVIMQEEIHLQVINTDNKIIYYNNFEKSDLR